MLTNFFQFFIACMAVEGLLAILLDPQSIVFTYIIVPLQRRVAGKLKTLLICPFCLSFWIALGISLSIGHINIYPICFILALWRVSYLLYFVIQWVEKQSTLIGLVVEDEEVK